MVHKPGKSLIFFLQFFLLAASLQAKNIKDGDGGRGEIELSHRLEPKHPALPVRGGSDKLPYHPQWVTVLKRGKIFKYKRKEFSSPIISGEKLFIGADSGAFYALEKKSGGKLWRYKTGNSINTTPAVLETKEGTRVFLGDDEALLHAFDAETGKEIWKTQLDSEITSAPAVTSSRIFVSTMEGHVFALDVDDGKIIWDKEHAFLPQSSAQGFEMTIRGYSSPALDEAASRLYVGFADGTLTAFSTDGKIVWEKSLTQKKGFQDIDGTPLLDADHLFVSTYSHGVYSISKKNGQVLWSQDFGSGVRMLLVENTLYVSGTDGHLYALNKKDGSKQWDLKLGTAALTAPVSYKDIIAVGLSDSTMNFIRRSDGHVLAKRFAKKGISSDPVVDEDRIYYLSNGGRVYSLKLVSNR